jgi:hypothetical protein
MDATRSNRSFHLKFAAANSEVMRFWRRRYPRIEKVKTGPASQLLQDEKLPDQPDLPFNLQDRLLPQKIYEALQFKLHRVYRRSRFDCDPLCNRSCEVIELLLQRAVGGGHLKVHAPVSLNQFSSDSR